MIVYDRLKNGINIVALFVLLQIRVLVDYDIERAVLSIDIGTQVLKRLKCHSHGQYARLYERSDKTGNIFLKRRAQTFIIYVNVAAAFKRLQNERSFAHLAFTVDKHACALFYESFPYNL